MKIITNAPILDKDKGKKTVISQGQPFGGYRDLIEFTDGDTGESLYWSADGDEYYNAKGEKIKNVFKAIGKGIGKGAKGVVKGVKWLGKNIAKASRWVVKKSKNAAKGTRRAGKGAKVKGKPLQHTQTAATGGVDKFIGPLPFADATTPKDKIIEIEGQKFSGVSVPANKPLIIATDPVTGKNSVGVEYNANDVVAVQGADGTYDYYPTESVQEAKGGMSNPMKVGLVVGGIAVVGVIIYFIAKKKK